jgi:FAD/FMN-containing dehydrogenase
MNDLKSQLQAVITGEVANDPTTLTRYSQDTSLFEVRPQVVTFPKTSDDVVALVQYVNKHLDDGLSLTARSGGTDMTGGPLNSSIIVDFNTHLNTIIRVTSDHAVTQPGAFYRDFDRETKKHGAILPSYPASREICTVGGMVANNSGGEKTLTYGKTERYAHQLKMVLHDGSECTFEPLTKKELQDKMILKTTEGKIYRGMYKLLERNYDLIQAAKPHVTKNSAGYLLWNVWDRKTFDLTKLIVGAQGTLGFTTEITFKLIKPKKHSRLLVIFLRDLSTLGQLVNQVLQFKPESFESYDDHTLNLAIRFLPQMIKQMKAKNLFALGLEFIPEFAMLLGGGPPKLVLLAEFTGDTEAETLKKAEQTQAAIEHYGHTTRITATKKETQKYWIVRRESFNLLRHHVRDKHTAPFIDDVVVTPAQLPTFLPELNEIMSHYNLIYTIAGHVGDANFHIIPLMNLKDPKARAIIPELSKKVYELVLKYHGSITGEHNDGLIRTPYLKQMYGKKIYKLFEATKDIFDPNNIFNPGKKVHGNLRYTLNHMKDN